MSIASFFKRAESSGSKRPREEDDAAPAAPKPHVRTLAAWNANSLIQRIQCNRPDLDRFLREHSPDVVFISEVRSPALGPAGCKKGDGQRRQQDKLSRASHSLASEADVLRRQVAEAGPTGGSSLQIACGICLSPRLTAGHLLESRSGFSFSHSHSQL